MPGMIPACAHIRKRGSAECTPRLRFCETARARFGCQDLRPVWVAAWNGRTRDRNQNPATTTHLVAIGIPIYTIL